MQEGIEICFPSWSGRFNTGEEGQLRLLLIISMAVLDVIFLLLFSPACLSVLVNNLDVQPEASRRLPTSPTVQNCLTTCLEGELSQICFDESIQDARPSPIVPDHVCKVTDCLVSNITCSTNETTLPLQCMVSRRAIIKQVNVDEEESTSVCNVPVHPMESCLFSPTSGSASVFSHGDEVTFDVQRKSFSKLKLKTCVCYNGRWISRNAVYSATSMKKSRILCKVHGSKNLQYLRATKVMEPAFKKNGVFAKLISEHSPMGAF